MSYAAKGEKVFDRRINSDCTPPVRRSDHRLKKFSSTLDKRAWHPCEEIRYRHLYDLMSGSQTCLSISQCHKYVPLDDLIRILMAEKDEHIKQLQERLRSCGHNDVNYMKSHGDDGTKNTRGLMGTAGAKDTAGAMGTAGAMSTAGTTSTVGAKDKKDGKSAIGVMDTKGRNYPQGALDTDDKTLLQGQVDGLTDELSESRNMLRQAMHKLQNIDEIVNENKKLQCRLRCSEERIKFLEEKKRNLESEIADLRSKSQIQIDLEKAQQMLSNITQRREESTEMDEVVLQNLTLERDKLQDKVKKLEKELEDSKKKETEIEILKKQSESDSLDKEEISRENECYRKKLASMKCLEKQIQELKKQGRALADKYRREAQKAAEQMSKMCQVAKELQTLRDERDSLRKRVNELASYECQYNKLQRKLQRVDAVIAENENLNSKLLALQNLEKENEYLRCRLDAIQEMETNAAEDKERIMQLQSAVADQEEEMKDLLCQIERLTSGKHEEEIERLKCELFEKNSKLKLCEEQLAEIPMLEAEIDELRMKLQSYCREFPDKKTGENNYQKIEVRLPATSRGIRANYKSPEEKCSSVSGAKREKCLEIMNDQSATAYKIPSELSKKKDMMSCEEVQSLLQSSKGIISCVLEDMIEHQKEMEELEICNRAMKEEIDALKEKVEGSDKENLLQEINRLKKCLRKKDLEISNLRSQCTNTLCREDIETLRQLNEEMKCELEDRKVSLTEDSDYCKALQKETDDLKLQIEALNQLTNELKKENELLRELQQPGPEFSKQLDEKCALENLLSSLQAELDAFKDQKLSNECEALRKELKRVMEQNCDLKTLVDCYRQRLDLEKKSNKLMKEGSCLGNKEQASFSGGFLKTREGDKQFGIQCGETEGDLSKSREGDKNVGIRPGETEYDFLKSQKGDKNFGNQPGETESNALKSQEGDENFGNQPGGTEGNALKPREGDKNFENPLGNTEGDISKSREGNENFGNQPGGTEGNALKSREGDKNFGKQLGEEGGGKPKSLEDCFKELERLRNENNDLTKKLEAGSPDELENLRAKIKELTAENADKIKKLMDQHEKELANREKTYNDNLKAMKSGYETDIRKLSERHKQSVVRLQELHQDEVQEINSNYEAQLDTMQIQSEAAINDIAQGSAAKIRKLVEKHSKEIGELRDSLTKSAKELETLKKRGKEFGGGEQSNLKAQQARLMQKMRRTSKGKMNAMKMKYEESKMKLEEETDSLKKKLREQAKGEGVCQCHFAKKRLRKARDPSCPLDFNEVLEKILEEGLDSLTFNEIALVHRKTCCALEGIVMKSNSNPMLDLEPPVNDSCPHTPLLEADKQQLLSRIFALENEILQKQKQTQDAIISMEVAIKKERCRLQEVRNSLESEQQKNSKLKLLLSSQTKVHSDLKRERDRLGNEASMHQMLCQERTKQLDEEVKTKKCLEMEIAKLKSEMKQLCAAVDAERGKCSPADPMEQMRVRLEQTVRHDRRLAPQLENENKCRMQLQNPVQGTKQSLRQMVTLPAVGNDFGFSQNPLEAKSAKEKQNLDQIKEKKNKIKTKCKKQKK